MGGVRNLAAERGAVVIEDAAQGTGASLDGRPAGSLGDLSVLSFGRGKGVTGGRGGALLCHDAGLTGKVAALAPAPDAGAGLGEVGKSLAQWVLARPSLYALPSAVPFLRLGETIYHPAHPAAGLPHSSAGILSVTMRLAEAEAARRRGNAVRLLEAARAAGFATIEPAPGAEPGYLRLPLLDTGPSMRTRARAARALGIFPGYPVPLAQLPGFAPRVRNRDAAFPGAQTLAGRLATLPAHSLLTEADLSRLERWLTALAGGGRIP
jgi:dTDP-4-amino-4,6-dideoxygalactose transaminase